MAENHPLFVAYVAQDGSEIYVNLNHAVYVAPHDDGCAAVGFHGQTEVILRCSPEYVLDAWDQWVAESEAIAEDERATRLIAATNNPIPPKAERR
jgi:hypothetical protein